MFSGRLFQESCLIQEKVRCAFVVVGTRGANRSPLAGDRNDRRLSWLETGTQSSLMTIVNTFALWITHRLDRSYYKNLSTQSPFLIICKQKIMKTVLVWMKYQRYTFFINAVSHFLVRNFLNTDLFCIIYKPINQTTP